MLSPTQSEFEAFPPTLKRKVRLSPPSVPRTLHYDPGHPPATTTMGYCFKIPLND